MSSKFLFEPLFVRLLGVGVLALLGLNALDLALGKPFWAITRFIDLDSDQNFSAWYSSMLLLIAGLVAFDCYRCSQNRQPMERVTLFLFALFLAVLSADEISRFHEILGGYLATYAGIADKAYAFRSAWVWVGGPIVLGVFAFFGFSMARMLKESPKAFSLLVLGFVCILVGGVLLESTINFMNHTDRKFLWSLEILAEETLEMLGSVLIAKAMMHLRDDVLVTGHPVNAMGRPIPA